MSTRKITAYMALRRADGSEPHEAPSYRRVYIDDVTLPEVPLIPYNRQIAFDDVAEPGYGTITHYCLFDCPTGGEPLWVWPINSPMNAKEGTVPLVHYGKFLLGVDVSASVAVSLQDTCAAVSHNTTKEV